MLGWSSQLDRKLLLKVSGIQLKRYLLKMGFSREEIEEFRQSVSRGTPPDRVLRAWEEGREWTAAEFWEEE